MSLRDAAQQALEALESDPVPLNAINNACAFLRAALAEPQPEPVAWMYHGIRYDGTPHDNPSLIWRPEYMDVMSEEQGAKATPLYTTPPQRQPLSDERIILIYETPELAGTKFANGTEKAIAIFRAAEKAHGIGGDK